MNLFSWKSKLLKAGLAVFVSGLAIVNYAQMNDSNAPSLVTIKDANATSYCVSAEGYTCNWTTPDGLVHTTINAICYGCSTK